MAPLHLIFTARSLTMRTYLLTMWKNICLLPVTLQNDVIHYITRDRLNNASFRQRLDPIAENVFQRQNPLELVFENISTFDAQNRVVGWLLQELDIGKKI